MVIDTNMNKLFPNTSIVAYYSPFGQHIVLNSIKQKHYENVIKDFYNPAYLSVVKTVSHELRHWRDHHTTLWGINSLIDIYNAINAKLINDPENFHYISKFIKSAKESNLTEYYYTIESSYKVTKDGLPWNWKYTVGSRFDHNGKLDHNKPIPFVRFLNPLNDDLLSRTPLSNSSLLETNAMCEEIKITSVVLGRMDKGELLVERKIMEKEYLNWLYNENLTLYSALAHITSTIVEDGDVFSTFRISNEISNLLLNLPNHLYQSILINPYFAENFKTSNLLIAEKSKGYTFYNLLLNYKDKNKTQDEFDINKLLEASDLPSVQDIEKLILKEFEKSKNKVINGPFKHIVLKKIDNAIIYFKKTGLESANSPVHDFFEYDNPTLIFGDTYIDSHDYNYEKFKSLVFNRTPLTNTGWYLMQQDIYKELEAFYNICGV